MSDAPLVLTLSNPECPQTEIPILSTKELDWNCQKQKREYSVKYFETPFQISSTDI